MDPRDVFAEPDMMTNSDAALGVTDVTEVDVTDVADPDSTARLDGIGEPDEAFFRAEAAVEQARAGGKRGAPRRGRERGPPPPPLHPQILKIILLVLRVTLMPSRGRQARSLRPNQTSRMAHNQAQILRRVIKPVPAVRVTKTRLGASMLDRR